MPIAIASSYHEVGIFKNLSSMQRSMVINGKIPGFGLLFM
jgi:hypothetical protein